MTLEKRGAFSYNKNIRTVKVNKVYRKIVVYNPITNTVITCKKLDYDDAINEKKSTEIFYELYMQTDKISEVIIGVSLCNHLYQLSPAPYGTYIKESASTAQFFNKSKFLVAVANYQKAHNIPFD